MALGIESNNLAPALIQSSGAALVQGIRQIGQQVSGHLTEMQTKRDLAALGQEAQALNVESNEFPTQLAQLVTRHPLAARDERGLMALSAMGKAHGQWQATEAEARAFNRAMAMQGARQRAAFTQAEAEEEWLRNRPVKPTASKGFVPAPGLPGFAFDKDEGKILPPPPELVGKLPVPVAKGALTENQRITQMRNARKDRLDAVQKEINELDQNIKSSVDNYNKTFERELAIEKEMRETSDEGKRKALESERSKFQSEKTIVGKLADDLKKLKEERMKVYKAMEAEILAQDIDPAGALPPVPDNALVPPNAVAPPVDNPNALVPVINPSGKPTNIKRSQLEAALQSGYTQR